MLATPLLLLASSLALQEERVAAPLAGPGNVLILLADDLGIDQLAAYGLGSACPPTPNLDRMAAEGVLFENVWSQPTCSPTRATIQTGRYGFRTTIGRTIPSHLSSPALPLAEVTLPEMLDLGTGGAYAHAAIGKWHLGNSSVGGDLAPNLAGYAHFAGVLEGEMTGYTDWRRVENGVGALSTRYATSACVDDALRWIRAQAGTWVCVVNFQAPHTPFHRPPDRLHSRVLPGAEPAPHCGEPGADPLPFHQAAVEALDTEIGRLVRRLPWEVLASTTVFFLGDNGTDRCIPQPPFTDQAKGTLHEGGVRVPLLAWGRGVARGATSPALVNTTDLFATVAELVGVDLAATLPGVVLDSRSFAATLAEPGEGPRRWLYAEAFAPNGPGQPEPLPACPPDFCQYTLGLDGPGDLEIASCGPPLYGSYGSNVVPVRIEGALPGATIQLRIGPYSPAYDPVLGAQVVSAVPTALVTLVAGADGTVETSLWTGGLSSDQCWQAVAPDPAQPGGHTVSDSLFLDLLPTDMQALRGPRYKLIRFDPCREELYDLQQDPFEQTDLLAGTPDSAALTARANLGWLMDHLR